MKKLLLTFNVALGVITASAQCVYTCSNYAVSPITFSTFPANGPDVISSFTCVPGGVVTDDGATGAIPIGFNFDFYCNTYSNVYIVSNGFIQFDHAPVDWSHGPYVHTTQTFPNTTPPNGIVAFNMTDMNPGVGGSISYTTVGTAPNRMFIVTYSNVPCFSSSDLNTGQIVLYETTNIIEIHTSTAKGDLNQSNAGTQGIEGLTAMEFEVAPGRNNNSTWYSSAQNTAYQFAPFSTPSLGAITGDTLLCEGTSGNYMISPATGASAYNWTAPNGWTGSGNLPAATFTAGTSGVFSVTAQFTCGVSAPATLAVNVLPAPVIANPTITPAIICTGNTIQINTAGAVNYTVQPGNGVGPGPFVDAPTGPIIYTVTGSDAAGCVGINQPTATLLVLQTPTVTVNSGSVCQGESFAIVATGAPQYEYSTPFPGLVTETVVGVHQYTVTGISSNGCRADAISTLTVNALPSTTLSAQRLEMCRNESNTITASGALNYSWTFTTSTAAQMVITPTVTNIYKVTGTTAEGCARTATLFIKVGACTGVEENAATLLKVFPNPSNGDFVIESPVEEMVIVYDLLGRDLQKIKLQPGRTTVNTDLPAGRYFIKGVESNTFRSFVVTRQ